MRDPLDLEEWERRFEADAAYRDKFLWADGLMYRSYFGKGYEKNDDPDCPENFFYSYVTNTVAGMVDRNPRVRTRSRRAGSEDVLSVPMRHGLNRWIKDEDLEETLKDIAEGVCFNWEVALLTNEPDAHQGSLDDRALFKDGKLRTKEGKYRPRMYAIHPKLFAADSRATSMAQAEYQFHHWFMSVSELEDEATAEGSDWDIDVVQDLIAAAGSTKDAATVIDGRHNNATDGEQLEFVSVWLPGLETDGKGPDDGYNGSILTFARTNQNEVKGKLSMPKPPVAYFGPKTGPYEVFGSRRVRGKLYPLGHLTANLSNIEALNATTRGIDAANAVGKNGLLYDLTKQEAAEAINNAGANVLIGIPNLDSTNIIQATFGFASEQQYKARAMHLDVLQRTSAMNDASQGNVTGRGTATENSISNEATMRRNGAEYQAFSKSVVRCLEKVAHWFYWDSQIEFDLGEEFFEAESDLNLPPGTRAVFRGGQQKANRKLSLADHEIEIEPYSMGRTDQIQLASSLGIWTQYLFASAQMRQAFPWIDWQAMDEMYAAQLNMPEFARMVDNKAAMASEPWQDGGERPQERFQRDALPAPPGARPRVEMNRPKAPSAGAPPPLGGLQAPVAAKPQTQVA